MEGVILATSHMDFISNVSVGDLICVDEELELYYTISEIDDTFKMNGNSKNEYKYIVLDSVGNKLNYKRSEFSLASLSVYDSKEYFKSYKKIKIGDLIYDDIRNMKFKAIIELDLPKDSINTITNDYLIGQTFNGEVIEKEIKTDLDFKEYNHYFKVK